MYIITSCAYYQSHHDRYIVIKHCPVTCCAPAEKVVSILNEKYLGASIQEVADTGVDNSETEFSVYGVQAIYTTIVTMLFIAG